MYHFYICLGLLRTSRAGKRPTGRIRLRARWRFRDKHCRHRRVPRIRSHPVCRSIQQGANSVLEKTIPASMSWKILRIVPNYQTVLFLVLNLSRVGSGAPYPR